MKKFSVIQGGFFLFLLFSQVVLLQAESKIVKFDDLYLQKTNRSTKKTFLKSCEKIRKILIFGFFVTICIFMVKYFENSFAKNKKNFFVPMGPSGQKQKTTKKILKQDYSSVSDVNGEQVDKVFYCDFQDKDALFDNICSELRAKKISGLLRKGVQKNEQGKKRYSRRR